MAGKRPLSDRTLPIFHLSYTCRFRGFLKLACRCCSWRYTEARPRLKGWGETPFTRVVALVMLGGLPAWRLVCVGKYKATSASSSGDRCRHLTSDVVVSIRIVRYLYVHSSTWKNTALKVLSWLTLCRSEAPPTTALHATVRPGASNCRTVQDMCACRGEKGSRVSRHRSGTEMYSEYCKSVIPFFPALLQMARPGVQGS